MLSPHVLICLKWQNLRCMQNMAAKLILICQAGTMKDEEDFILFVCNDSFIKNIL